MVHPMIQPTVNEWHFPARDPDVEYTKRWPDDPELNHESI
jgi:hypothetical protein